MTKEGKIAKISNLTEEQVAIIKNTVAKGVTDTELAYFLQVCKTIELNPFNKEIWCYKDGKGNLIVFTGRDGLLSKAQKNPNFNGIRSCEIKEKDEWFIDIPTGKIHHKIKSIDRGNIIGAYALVFRKDGEPTVEFVEFATYNKGYNTWKTHPAEMIKKVAESKALKKAFGISMVQIEEDFNIKDEKIIDTNPLPELLPNTENWNNVLKAIANGYTISDVEKKYYINDQNKKLLENETV